MADLRLVTYCGLFCDLCAQRGRIPSLARSLREAMAKEGYEYWGAHIAHFTDFWTFLGQICDPDAACPGCRQGAGPEFCGIRKCARGRGVEVCPFCEEYPCQRVLELAKGYPTLIPDGRRMCEIGLDRWVVEQQDRARAGFIYADIRCHPYKVPEE